jgi:hypothetical protein
MGRICLDLLREIPTVPIGDPRPRLLRVDDDRGPQEGTPGGLSSCAVSLGGPTPNSVVLVVAQREEAGTRVRYITMLQGPEIGKGWRVDMHAGASSRLDHFIPPGAISVRHGERIHRLTRVFRASLLASELHLKFH